MEQMWEQAKRAEAIEVEETVAPVEAVAGEPITEAEKAVVTKGVPGKVLVTGATGFLGQRLVMALARCGLKVVALVRDPNRAPLEFEGKVEVVKGDLRDAASIEAAMKDVALVYHCAAITG